MAGKIRTNEKCSECGGAFEETIIGNRVDLLCPCRRRPGRYYIDARHMGVKKVYSDRKGIPLASYEAARGLFDEMDRKFRADPIGFDPSPYAPSLRKHFLIERESSEWLRTLTQDKSAAFARHCESFFRVHIVPEFGSTDIRELNAKMVEVFYRKLIDKKLAPKSISSILKALKVFLKYEHRLGVIEDVPLFPVFKARPVKEKGWLHTEKQGKVLAAMISHRLIFETMMGLGIRAGEAVALQAQDVLPEGYIRIVRAIDEAGNVRPPKNGKGREMRVPPELHAKLMIQARGKFPKAWLFTNRKGGHYTWAALDEAWQRACRITGIKIPMGQACRHSRGTQLWIEKQDEAVMAVAGTLGNTVDVAKASYIQSVKEGG